MTVITEQYIIGDGLETDEARSDKFNNGINESLNQIYRKIDETSIDYSKNGYKGNIVEKDDEYWKLLVLHRIDYDKYHDMRREFRDDDTYNVWVLNETTVREKFDKLEEYYNPNKNQSDDDLFQKYLMISFDENNRNEAKFNIEAVWGHTFGNYFSCYSEKFLMTLFGKYKKVKLVKSKDKLNKMVDGQVKPQEVGSGRYKRKYQGNFNMVCVHCEGFIEGENIPGFKDNEFFDVVHDPDNPPGGRRE